MSGESVLLDTNVVVKHFRAGIYDELLLTHELPLVSSDSHFSNVAGLVWRTW